MRSSLLGAAFFLQGLGATATNVHTYAIRQAVTPDRLMGRTTAVYRALTHGFVPLGALLGGLLGDALGLRPALGIAALALFPSWLWLYFSPARSLRELTIRHENEPAFSAETTERPARPGTGSLNPDTGG